MSKTRYYFNPETVSYEKVTVNFRMRLVKLLKLFLFGLAFAAVLILTMYHSFSSPKEKTLARENHRLATQYKLLDAKLNQMQSVLTNLSQRDDDIYRVIFEAEPIHPNVRKAGFGGINRYEHLESMDHAELVISTSKKLDQLAKSLYVQSKSYDDVEEMAKNKFKMLAAIPAIMPVSIKDFNRISAGYGWRIHPIYKTRKFHDGMDFTGKTGTPIYATGDGEVKLAKKERGYGKKIVIDHGYGYTTIYAHLHSYNVKRGQKVKRGEVIGTLGNTGISTGPHLHYEVRKNNRTVNPVNYYFNDLTAEEYEQVVAYAENNGQAMD